MAVAQRHPKIQVFAVVRLDQDQTADDAITVKEILPTKAEAEQEVKRLNSLNKARRCHYFWQATRYFPEGRNR